MLFGPVFRIKGTVDRPYGEYTVEVREKEQPNGPVLASAIHLRIARSGNSSLPVTREQGTSPEATRS